LAALPLGHVGDLSRQSSVCEWAVYRSQPPESLPREAASNQVVVGDIPLEPPGFQPRIDLLAELDRARVQVPVVHVVTGRPGVGKTMLAAAYARAKLAAGWRLVAWVNAEDTWSLLAGLARTADAVGLNESDAGRDTSDPGRLVRRRLEADGDRCLIVFDNARDPDLLQPFVPAYGAARVLITGPRRSPAILGTSVPVDVFSGDEAMAFLTARTGRVDAEGAAALAAELGYLPLALAQAASVIAQHSLGYRAYLELLRAVPVEESLSRAVGQPSVPGIAQAVLLSLEDVRAADHTGTCTQVIELLAVLSAAGVRRDLLHAAGQEGALATGGKRVAAALVDEALARLAERAFVTVSLDGETIMVHPTLMLVVRTAMAREQRLTAVCGLAASVLEARALAVSLDRLAVADVPEQVSALVDNAAGPVGEDKELARALLRLLAAAYRDASRDTRELASTEPGPTQEIAATEESSATEQALTADEVVPAEEAASEVAPPEVAPADEVVPAGEVVSAEVAPAEEVVAAEEVAPVQEVAAAEKIPSAEDYIPPSDPILQSAAIVIGHGSDHQVPGEEAAPEPETSMLEPSVTPGERPGRPRRLRVLGLAAAILIIAAASGGTVLLSRPHVAGRPPSQAAAPVSGPAQMAAGWVSQQVSRSAIVACDPAMCAALEARGVPAANLLALHSSTPSPLAAQVVVATSAVRSQFGSRLVSVYAPTIIATFGSGPEQVNVRVVAPDGAAVYLASLRQDVAARKAAGAQLLTNKRIAVTAQAKAQLAAGVVDSRLLILLPALATVHPIQILAFGDPGPGASPGIPWCSADLSGSGRAAGMTDLSYVSWLAGFVEAQLVPFAGSITTLKQDGQLIVRVEFARPSPLGLLTHR